MIAKIFSDLSASFSLNIKLQIYQKSILFLSFYLFRMIKHIFVNQQSFPRIFIYDLIFVRNSKFFSRARLLCGICKFAGSPRRRCDRSSRAISARRLLSSSLTIARCLSFGYVCVLYVNRQILFVLNYSSNVECYYWLSKTIIK